MSDNSIESVGRYQVTGEVGAGSRSFVYQCFDPILKRHVAVKVPSIDLDGDEFRDVIEKFHHEAEIGAQFQHANIVTVYDVGSDVFRLQDPDSHAHFLVMELARGINLRDYLQQHKQLPVEETLQIIFECCKALDYIHYKGVLHRDIKPGNIIYDPDSKSVKITDFGISDYVDHLSKKQIGTLPYSSPEHFIVDKTLTYQTDIFALGSVMYELLTGVCPFHGASVDEVASNIVTSHPKPVREYREDIPMQVEFILLKAMSKSQRDRFQNAVEFTDAVSLAMKTIGKGKNAHADKRREDAEIDEYLLLRNHSWFSEFSPAQVDELVRSGRVLSYAADEYIVREGEEASSFYTLLEGQAEVVKEDQFINQLNPGTCFGEVGHLTKTSIRTASIRAVTSVRVLVVDIHKLLNMSAESQLVFYKAFLTVTMERLLEKNIQSIALN